MLKSFKKRPYFIVAAYFAFWAKFVLIRWRPRIIVITGSTGKTTLLHLVEAQLGEKAIYTHHANSSFGIPFHILGLKPNVESKIKWLSYILRAPLQIFRARPHTKLYVVEADCDRPHEGVFLSKLLKPEVVLWVSVYRTHSMNFDSLVPRKSISHERAIASEFANFAARANRLVVLNADQPELLEEGKRVTKVDLKEASIKNLLDYKISQKGTIFNNKNHEVTLPGLHPKEVAVSLQMVDELMSYLNLELDNKYQKLEMPPGRSNVFAGKNNAVLIDSTYNTGLGAMKVLLRLFDEYPSKHKWLVLGDILEQGSLEKVEHKRLGEAVDDMDVERVILLGPRTKADTYPALQKKFGDNVVSFESPKEVLDYLNKNLKGGETLLFKGGRFPESVIEQLLVNPDDAKHLVRRSKAWTKRRQKWGLPK